MSVSPARLCTPDKLQIGSLLFGFYSVSQSEFCDQQHWHHQGLFQAWNRTLGSVSCFTHWMDYSSQEAPPLSPSRMCACVTRDAALPRDRVNNTKNNCEIGNCNLGSILHWPFFLSVLPCSEGTLESLKCGDFVLIKMYEVESFSIYLLNSENLN